MKEFVCKKDYYTGGTKFASIGDHIILMQDNTTVINTNGNQRTLQMPEIVKDKEHFTPTFEIKDNNYIEEDKINHPKHYTWLKEKCGIEVIDITRHLDFCTGNAIKYLLRAGHKSENGITNKEKTIQDLKKAIWYINDKINQIQNEN